MKRLESALVLGGISKFFAFVHHLREARIGLEVLATLLLSYWLVGSYCSSGYIFALTLLILAIPFIPIEKLLELDDTSDANLALRQDENLKGGFWPNEVIKRKVLPVMRNNRMDEIQGVAILYGCFVIRHAVIYVHLMMWVVKPDMKEARERRQR